MFLVRVTKSQFWKSQEHIKEMHRVIRTVILRSQESKMDLKNKIALVFVSMKRVVQTISFGHRPNH